MTHRRILGAAAALTLTLTTGVTAATAPAGAAPAAACGDQATVKETLPNGTTWKLCWHMDATAGLVLSNVTVSSVHYPNAVQVLDSIRLGQLNVPYDSGNTEYNDLTDYGFGGYSLITLDANDCRNGSMRTGSDGSEDPTRRKVLCVSAEQSGPAYRLQNWEGAPYTKTGSDLVLRSVSQIGWYEYITEYRLSDNGQISSRLGATGDLSPSDYVGADDGWPIGKGAKDFASNHYHSAFWRVDFNIGGAGQEKVEQFDTAKTGTGEMAAKLTTTRTPITSEGKFTRANQRWWRVVSPTSKNRDQHNRSYELVFGANDVYPGHPEMTPDVTFSQAKSCEKFATDNKDPECPEQKTILKYIKDGEALTDPIMWVRVGFHHVPRDEDQSPMPTHWQGFDLVPRDFTEVNRLAPDELTGINGQPDQGR